MINDTLKHIEEEFDKQSGLYNASLLNEDAFLDAEKVKSFLKSSIIKVLQQLIERENGKMFSKMDSIITKKDVDEYRDRLCFNEAKQDTISYLKSEIATLSTNIDK